MLLMYLKIALNLKSQFIIMKKEKYAACTYSKGVVQTDAFTVQPSDAAFHYKSA